MMKLSHKFVKNVPDELEDKVIYVSVEYSTVIHKCCCGCGNEIVTPIAPTDWKLIFNGESISLYPSIGNWSFECRSHYWIRNNQIEWAEQWSDEEIKAGRYQDYLAKKAFYNPNTSRVRKKSKKKNSVSKINILSNKM